MVVNFTDNFQFSTRLNLEDNLLEQVRETRLLGVVINDGLTWHSNTDFIVKKAYKRMILLHKLFEFDLSLPDMINIYTLYIRSILESSAVVWHSDITKSEQKDIERVQKVALRIILNEEYEDYPTALATTGLLSLSDRRTFLCKNFAENCTKSDKMCHMFPLNPSTTYYVQPASTGRLKDSAIPYM